MINESTNVVDNICVWDGNPNTWTPPSGYLMLVEADTQALIWIAVYEPDPITKKPIVVDYVLTETLGAGAVGFTWDGTVLTTNQPKPVIPA